MKQTSRNTCCRFTCGISHFTTFLIYSLVPYHFQTSIYSKINNKNCSLWIKLVKYISKNRIHVTRRHVDDWQTKRDINNECISFALPLVNKRQKYSGFAIDRRSAIVVRNNKFSSPIKFVFPSAYLKSQWFTLKNGFIRH